MFEDLDIPQNFRKELLPLLRILIQLQKEVAATASGFKKESFYFIPTLLILPSSRCTGRALLSRANSSVSYFIKLVEDAARGEHHSSDINMTIVDQLRAVIDYDYDIVRNELEGINAAVEVNGEDELKERQERHRADRVKWLEKELPGYAQYRKSQMH